MSFISLVSSAKLDPCHAIGRTHEDLSNIAVIFVTLEVNRTYTNQTDFFSDLFTTDFSSITNSRVALELMETFFECYGKSGNLHVEKIVFEKQLGERTCFVSKNSKKIDYQKLRGKEVTIVESSKLSKICGNRTLDSVISKLKKETSIINRNSSVLCYFQECREMRERKVPYIPITLESMAYEKLEIQVDGLASNDSNITEKYEGLVPKYTYLFSVPTSIPTVWPALFSIFLVILFFLTGLFMCCCGLFIFSLVEEDFQMRNEEREWFAMNMRREEYPDIPIPMIPASPVVRSHPNASIVETMSVRTARSRFPSKSQSSSDVVTDRTQLSETISGCSSSVNTGIEKKSTAKDSELETARNE